MDLWKTGKTEKSGRKRKLPDLFIILSDKIFCKNSVVQSASEAIFTNPLQMSEYSRNISCYH